MPTNQSNPLELTPFDLHQGTISGTFKLLEPDHETFRNRLLQLVQSDSPLDITAIVPQAMDQMASTFFDGARPKMDLQTYSGMLHTLEQAFRALLPPWVTIKVSGVLRVNFELPMPAPVKLYANAEPIVMQKFSLQGYPVHDAVTFEFVHQPVIAQESVPNEQR